jgi:hypothetical protein
VNNARTDRNDAQAPLPVGPAPILLWFVLAAAALAAAATFRGVWLDELWSLILSDPSQSPAAMLGRWLNDAHPLLPNAAYHIVLAIEPERIGWQRLLLNLPALLFFLAGSFVFLRRTAGPRSFHVVTAMLILSLQAFASGFSEFRTYAWQLCAAGLVAQLAHFLTTGGGAARPDVPSRVVGALAVLVAISLHYVGGLIASIPVALLLLHLFRLRAWTWFWTLALAAGVGWVLMLIQAAVQIPNLQRNIDVSWISTTSLQALTMFGATAGALLIANPVAALFALLDRNRAWALERHYLVLIGASLIGSAALLLLLNAVKPVVIDRYLVGWQALLVGGVAALCCRAIASSTLRSWIFGGVAAIACLAVSVHYASSPNWHATRDYLATTARHCPEARIFAMNPWRVAARGSRVEAFEGEAFAFGYRRLARRAGFAVTMLPDDMTVLPVSPGCPTLLWVENAGPDNQPRDVLRAAGLLVPPGTRLGMFRGRSGFVLIAIQPQPLAARPGLG